MSDGQIVLKPCAVVKFIFSLSPFFYLTVAPAPLNISRMVQKKKLGLNLDADAVAELMGYVGEQKAKAALGQTKRAVKIGDVASEALRIGLAQLRKKK